MPQQVTIFTLREITRGPDEIRGEPGSLAFIYTKYQDPDGNRWFVQPGFIGHEEMTNSHAMLRALFGPEAGRIAGEVVTVGEVYLIDERGHHAPTGEKTENFDWWLIRQLAKRENLFGRAGTLGGHEVVMLWRVVPGWEAMLAEVLRLLGIGPVSEVVVMVGNDRQYWAREFLAEEPGDP